MTTKLKPRDLDEGIRATVLLLRRAGFKTFTSCEGGRGHADCALLFGHRADQFTNLVDDQMCPNPSSDD